MPLQRPLLALLVALWALPAAAQSFSLAPLYVLIGPRERVATLSLSNRGETAETFRLSLTDRAVAEDGRPYEVASPPPGDAFGSTLLRLSPAQVRLAPGETQTIRLLVQAPADLPPGEYRTYVLAQQLPRPEAPAPATPGGDAGLSTRITTIYGVMIPVVLRRGQLEARVAFVAGQVARGADGQPTLELLLAREGTRSTHGDIVATLDGREVGRSAGVNFFLSTQRRRLSIPLSLTEADRGRRIEITYTGTEGEPTGLLARATVTVP